MNWGNAIQHVTNAAAVWAVVRYMSVAGAAIIIRRSAAAVYRAVRRWCPEKRPVICPFVRGAGKGEVRHETVA